MSNETSNTVSTRLATSDLSTSVVAVKLPAELLRGRTAIVTGASRGTGRAIALRLAEAGANVVVNFLQQEEAAARVVEEIKTFGVEALAVQADVSSVEQAEMLAARCVERFGVIDVLIANAGIWEGAPIETMTDELWDKVINSNLKGTWSVCRAAVPAMKRNVGGSIVIISSTAGQRGEANYSNYAASKGGQISLCKSLAAELAPQIRVNAVAPGWIDTEMNTEVFRDENFKRKTYDAIPLHRIATPDDVALSAVFLASDWARHITGEILNLNGGSVLCG